MISDKQREYNKRYYAANKEKFREYKKRHYRENKAAYQLYNKINRKRRSECRRLYYQKHIAKSRAERRSYYGKNRDRVFQHYGSKCAWCCDPDTTVLSIDHVNNDGAKLRKLHGIGITLYRYIINNGYPPCFQLLCYNCNCYKGRRNNAGKLPPHRKDLFKNNVIQFTAT